MIPWWFTELGNAEKEQMLKAFDSKCLTLSAFVKKAEALFASSLDVPYALMVNSGSSALLASLLALDIKPNDEVIIPSLTWIATAQAPAILGAKVILCDSLSSEPILDVQKLESLITPKTKAIIPVHLNGRECNLEAIQSLASRNGAFIIEDACKALFSRGKKGFLGTIGDIGCFSLGMISLVSVGYGGLVVTRKQELYEKLKKIRDHGVQRIPEGYPFLGFNFKISDLLASLAIPQIQKLKNRAQNAVGLHNFYSNHLKHPEISILPIDKASGKVPIYVEAYSEKREKLLSYLKENNIQVSCYHLPTHRASYLNAHALFPNAEKFAKNAFILPSGPAQNLEDVSYVIKTLNEFPITCGVLA